MVSHDLARFVSALRFDELPPLAIRNAKLSLLDAVGVSLGASGLEPACGPFIALAHASGGAPQAAIFGTGLRTSAAQAAMANGAMAHALDFEDIHDASGMHPNGPTVPAAIALAEAHGPVSGRELITAIVAGSEVGCRLALAARRPGEGSASGFFEPAVMAAYGATAAAGRVLGLTAEQMLDAWSLTLCQTSMSEEYRRSPLSHIRAVRDAFGAQTAAAAALLARAGVVGFERPFEGEAGFFRLYGYETWDAQALTGGLGQAFALEAMSYKVWPSCRGTHLYVQAALALRAELGFDPAAIESVEAVVRPYDLKLCEPADSKRAPKTAIDAKFSIPFCIAAAFRTGRIDLATFEDLADPSVLDLAARVTWRVDADIARTRHEGGADVLLVGMRDGTRVARGVDAYVGSPEAPLDEAQMTAKFVACGRHARRPLPDAELQEIAAAFLALDDVEDTRALLARL